MAANENRKDTLIIFSVALATFMARLDSYIVNVSLPTMAQYFNCSLSDISRVTFVYILAAASTLLLFGKMADRIGLRRLFLWGYLVFTGGSLMCGLSPGIDMLTFSRFVQGIGSSMTAAASLAIISRYIPREKTGRAFGVFTSASALGITLGAPLGGLITDFISWHWIFLINVPIGIAAIVLAGRALLDDGRHERPAAAGKFDLPGAVLIPVSISLLLFAMNKGQEHGWTSIGIVSAFIFSALCAAAFILREKRSASPLIDLALLKKPRIYFPLIANFIFYMTIAAHNFLIPFYLDLVKHMTAFHIGMFLMIYSVMFVIVPLFAGRISDKTSPVAVSVIAMAVTAFSFFFFSSTLQLGGLLFVVVFFIVRAIGNGIFVPPNNMLIMQAAPEKSEGAVSGILNMMSYLGATIGVVLFETIFSQIVHLSGSAHVPGGPGIAADSLYSGFRHVFTALGAVSVIGAIVSYLAGTGARTRIKESGP